MPKKTTLLFFLLIIVSVILMIYQSKKGHFSGGNSLNDLLNNLHSTTDSFGDKIKRPFKRMALREEENNKLRQQVSELMTEREKCQEALLENKRLRELLNIHESRRNVIAAARVIARGVDHWAKMLTLDKGTKEGIEKDLSAITPKGLAGKIMSASDSYSNLLLLTDINFSASVRLQENRNEGVISGTGTRKCVLKYIPYEEEVKTGDIVITSGLDALFPPGIPVGYISKVDKSGTGHFQYIEVTPFQDDFRIEEVIIVK